MTATRQSRPVVLLRPVPGTSVDPRTVGGHQADRGASSSRCCWRSIRAGCRSALVAALVARRHPAGAHPAGCGAVGAEVAVAADRCSAVSPPHWPEAVRCSHLWSVDIGLGGLLNFSRITALSIVLLALGAMVSWTTNVADIAPAVSTLGRPLRWLRIPVDDWAVALALALRAFPMLIDEFRLLYAARRLRPRPVLHDAQGPAPAVGHRDRST